MKTAVYYVRVSTKDGKQSVDSQIPPIKRYCDNNGFTILKGFEEEVSGVKKHDEREQLTALLKYIKENKTDVLVVYELSRLGRSVSDLLNIIDLLHAQGVSLHVSNEGWKTLDDDGKESFIGKLLISIVGICAEMEREKIIDRTTRGLSYSSKYLNRWTGGRLLPYGYRREEKVLTIDDDEAIIVEKIFTMVLEGKGSSLIADYLNERKVPTRYNKSLTKPVKRKNQDIYYDPSFYSWKDATVYSILTNTIYKGIRMYKDEEISAPIIIQPEIFDKVQTILKDRYNKKDNNLKHFYLLRDVKLICGECGNSYFPHKRKDGSDNRYICLSKRYKKPCTNTGIGIDKLNSGVWCILRWTDDLKKHIEKGLNTPDLNKRLKSLDNEIKKIDKSLAEFKDHEAFILKMKKIGKLSEELYIAEFDKVRINIKKCTVRKSELVTEIDEIKTQLNQNFDINQIIRDIKDDKELMKTQITALVKSLTILPVNNIKLGKIKDDKVVLIKMFLKQSPNPLYFCISQRSDYILSVDEKFIDFSNHTIDESIVDKKVLIPYFIKS